MSYLRMSWMGLLAGVVVLAAIALPAPADPVEPTPEPAWRDLRDNHKNTWSIFMDTKTDGILDPGDRYVTSFVNWWTPVSASTQHNYTDGPYGAGQYYYPSGADLPSAPMSFASYTDPTKNYWLPLAENEIHFYMTYSQYDNNDFTTYADGATPGTDLHTLITQRNMERNGWALGWVNGHIAKDANGDPIYTGIYNGDVGMDIFVHEGKKIGGDALTADFGSDGIGTSRSNPQVSLSNDIDPLAHGSLFHPPSFDEVTQTYKTDSPVNEAYKNLINSGAGITDAEFDQIVASMEVFEVDPMGLGAGDVINPDDRPSEIAANLTDHAGSPYIYQDAVLDRSTRTYETNDGGVIAGLSGWDATGGDFANLWGAQQVIRIDISPETLSQLCEVGGGITKIVFYDFGWGPGASQISPIPIEFFAQDGKLFLLDGGQPVYFPDNRIYIAHVPEPSTLALLVVVGGAMLLRRRRGLNA